MLELVDALERISNVVPLLPSESVPLAAAANRILAEPVLAPVALPLFDNSAMDGYAVRAADIATASAGATVRLRCMATVPAGSAFTGTVESGTCVRIFTGSPLPSGADAVVMQEDTRRLGDVVEVIDGVKPWENVRSAGQDLKRGDIAANAGVRLSPGRAGLLAALGVERVSVARQPVIAILSTGDELIQPGATPAPGQIFESNRITLEPLVLGAGGVPRALSLIGDDKSETVNMLRDAFSSCDAVITTGGVSVGEHDLVKAAFESLGGELDFWKVNVKPGKPFAFGQIGSKLFFGLPGNPVSAFVTFLLLVRPAILKMQGAAALHLPSHPAVLAEACENRGDRRHFMRVAVDDAGQVRSAGVQASHMLSSLAEANALLDVPPKTSWRIGQSVSVLRWTL